MYSYSPWDKSAGDADDIHYGTRQEMIKLLKRKSEEIKRIFTKKPPHELSTTGLSSEPLPKRRRIQQQPKRLSPSEREGLLAEKFIEL